ncbi:MAG: DNA alkylation repair protein [Oscillospiraceae bacterium]|nr:DNA alkylation repair protein [Oscillospiraceae bacterium]
MELIRQSWSEKDYKEFFRYLTTLSDDKYKEFNSRIIPDTPLFIGIRIPEIRNIAKEISKGNHAEFLSIEKGGYHEEIITDGLVRAAKKCGYDEMLQDIIIFSSKIYNWAICDTVSFKGIKKHMPEFWADKDILLKSENPWQVRFGLGILMKFYLTDDYTDDVLEICANTESDFYYVNMMRAWVIATAAAKFPEKVNRLLESGGLSDTVLNMTVRKMLDSYRITDENKNFARRVLKKRLGK